MTCTVSEQSRVGTVAEHLWLTQTPYNVILELGLECNIHCAHCYQEGLREDVLPLDRVLTLLDELKLEGTTFLGINGGEPTISPKFWPVVEAASAKGFLITIYTNGTRIDQAAVDRILPLSIFEIRVSLYGAEAFHNDFVRSKNAYARTVRAIELLCKAGLRVVVTTCALPGRDNEAEHVRDLANEFGATFSIETTIYPKAISPKALGMPGVGNAISVVRLQLSRGAKSASESPDLNTALHAKAQQRGVCLAGAVTCSISPSGLVMPCSMLRIPAGDLSKATFGAIWRDASLFGWFRSMEPQSASLGSSSSNSGCDGCRMAGKLPAFASVT